MNALRILQYCAGGAENRTLAGLPFTHLISDHPRLSFKDERFLPKYVDWWRLCVSFVPVFNAVGRLLRLDLFAFKL